jgi:hypothetical protein
MTQPTVMVSPRLLLITVAAGLLVLAASGPRGLPEAVAYLLPPLLLLLALVACRYPGERALLALIGPAHRKSRSPGTSSFVRVRPRAMVPRGGSLIGSTLAVRPPPAPRVAPS